MNKKDIEIQLAEAFVSLRSGNPQAWDRFMSMLAARLEMITEDQMSSPPDNTLFVMQGRSQEARALFTQLAKAPSLVEELRQKAQTNGQRPTQGQPQRNRP